MVEICKMVVHSGKYRLYRIKWYLAQYINFKSPVHVDLELNNNCNQKCIMCWHSENKKMFEIKTMDIIAIQYYIRRMRKLGAMSIKLNLRGEPTLYKHLMGVVAYCKSAGYVDIMINTNGIKLVPEYVMELYRAGITKIIISVDSFDEKSYCKIHGCDKKDYWELMLNLSMIGEMIKNNRLKGLSVILNFHISKYNAKAKYGIPYYIFGTKRKIRYTEAREGADISIKRVNKKRKKKCPHMQRRLTILSNGKIYPCCVCYKEPSDIKLGDAMTDIDSAWNGEKRKKLLEKYNKEIYYDTCSKCTSGDIY